MNTGIAFSNHCATLLTDLDEHASVYITPLLTLGHYYSIQASSCHTKKFQDRFRVGVAQTTTTEVIHDQ